MSRLGRTRRLARHLRLLLPLFLLGLLLEAHHRAAYRHEVCPRDGELAHAGEEHRHDDAPHGSDEEDAEHDHCGLPTFGTKGEPPTTSFELLGVHRTLERPAPVPHASPLAAPIPLVLLAPKNSPPA